MKACAEIVLWWGWGWRLLLLLLAWVCRRGVGLSCCLGFAHLDGRCECGGRWGRSTAEWVTVRWFPRCDLRLLRIV
jgi:hypothetical protein